MWTWEPDGSGTYTNRAGDRWVLERNEGVSEWRVRSLTDNAILKFGAYHECLTVILFIPD